MTTKTHEDIARNHLESWNTGVEATQKLIGRQIAFQKDLLDRIAKHNMEIAEETTRTITDTMTQWHGMWRESVTRAVPFMAGR